MISYESRTVVVAEHGHDCEMAPRPIDVLVRVEDAGGQRFALPKFAKMPMQNPGGSAER